jgi:CheY-like chemotaxis protein
MEQTSKPPRSQPPHSTEAPLRVLVVEDEQIVAMDLEDRLRNFGFEAIELASNGPEAIRTARRFAPDLVLMDIALGGTMDGIEAAARIMERRQVPILFVTAHGDDETTALAVRTLTAPFIRFLMKPFTDASLRMAVQAALRQRE